MNRAPDLSKSRFSSQTKHTLVTYTEPKGDMTKVAVQGVDKEGKPIAGAPVGLLHAAIERQPAVIQMAAKPIRRPTEASAR